MLNYFYCNSALIIYICTIYLFYVKKHIKDQQSRFFELLLLISMSSCIFDIISEATLQYISTTPLWQVYLTVLIYYLLQSSIPFLSSLYILSLIDRLRQLELKEKIILLTPFLVSRVLLLLNYWTNMFFYVDHNMKYHHGIGFALLFVQSGYYLLLNIVYLTYYRKYVARRIRYLLISFSFIVVFFIVLELYLDILIQNFGIAVCQLLLFIVIQNSEEALVDSTGLFTKDALIRRVQLDMKNKAPFTLILVKLEDKAVINYTFGLNYWFAILTKVSAYLGSLGRAYQAINLQDGLFAVRIRDDLSIDDRNRLIKHLSVKFEYSTWNILNTELSLSTQLLELSYPKDIGEINDLLYYIEYYSKNVITSKGMLLTAEDLSVNLKQDQTEVRKKLWDIVNSSQYELIYMPIYSVSEQRILSREPLLKLPTEPPVYVSQGELDHVTEDYRRLKQIHESIFEEICIYIKDHPPAGDDKEFMNVNLTAAQLMQEGLIPHYSALIDKYGIDYHRLGIEMSETAVSYAQPTILQNILSMKSYGVTFILDHFGTGYNSLDYFKYVPFELVKLDKTIVQACLDNDKGLTVLKSTIAMMKQLKVTIIADGIDTKELADQLISLGVDLLEGSYYQ